MENIKTREELSKKAFNKVFLTSAFCTDEFVDLFLNLIDRVYDTDIEDLDERIDQAINEGMIYTCDQWVAYRHYCDMGDPVDQMWEGLYNDLYTVFNED